MYYHAVATTISSDEDVLLCDRETYDANDSVTICDDDGSDNDPSCHDEDGDDVACLKNDVGGCDTCDNAYDSYDMYDCDVGAGTHDAYFANHYQARSHDYEWTRKRDYDTRSDHGMMAYAVD